MCLSEALLRDSAKSFYEAVVLNRRWIKRLLASTSRQTFKCLVEEVKFDSVLKNSRKKFNQPSITQQVKMIIGTKVVVWAFEQYRNRTNLKLHTENHWSSLGQVEWIKLRGILKHTHDLKHIYLQPSIKKRFRAIPCLFQLIASEDSLGRNKFSGQQKSWSTHCSAGCNRLVWMRCNISYFNRLRSAWVIKICNY